MPACTPSPRRFAVRSAGCMIAGTLVVSAPSHALTQAELEARVAALSAQLPQPVPAMQPVRPRKTWIAPGTPCEFQQPYLKDFTPSVIRKDGTQVYRGIPMKMRQPDGTMKECPVTVTVAPAATAPVLAEELEATPETQAQAPAATGK